MLRHGFFPVSTDWRSIPVHNVHHSTEPLCDSSQTEPFSVNIATNTPRDHNKAHMHAARTWKSLNPGVASHISESEIVDMNIANPDQIVELMESYGGRRQLHFLFKNFKQWAEVIRNHKWSQAQLSIILRSFQFVDMNARCAAEIIEGVTEQIKKCKPLYPVNIRYSLQGISSSSCSSLHVENLLKELTINFASSQYSFSGPIVASCLHSVNKLSSNQEVVRQLVNVLATRLTSPERRPLADATSRNWRHRHELSGSDVGYALLGLRQLSSQHVAVRNLVSALAGRLRYYDRSHPFAPRMIGNALFGLQNMSSNDPSVCLLLQELNPLIRGCNETFRFSEIAFGLYGLRLCSCSAGAVRELVTILVSKLRNNVITIPEEDNCADHWYTFALQGLSSMTTDYPEVRELLGLLNQRFEEAMHRQAVSTVEADNKGRRDMNAVLSPLRRTSVSNALLGLGQMNSSYPEVQQSLSLIDRYLFQSPRLAGNFTIRQMSQSIHALRSMSADNKAVQDVLQIIADRLEPLTYAFNGYLAAHALCGLRNMNTGQPNVRELLRVILPKVEGCVSPVEGKHIGTALYGLKSLSSECEEVRMLMKAINTYMFPLLKQQQGRSSARSHHPHSTLFDINDDASNDDNTKMGSKRQVNEMESISCLNALRGLQFKTVDHPEVVETITLLTSKLQSCTLPFMSKPLCYAIGAFTHLKHTHPAVQELLIEITRRLEKARGNIWVRELEIALSGLAHMQPGSNTSLVEADEVVEQLRETLRRKALQAGRAETTAHLENDIIF